MGGHPGGEFPVIDLKDWEKVEAATAERHIRFMTAQAPGFFNSACGLPISDPSWWGVRRTDCPYCLRAIIASQGRQYLGGLALKRLKELTGGKR